MAPDHPTALVGAGGEGHSVAATASEPRCDGPASAVIAGMRTHSHTVARLSLLAAEEDVDGMSVPLLLEQRHELLHAPRRAGAAANARGGSPPGEESDGTGGGGGVGVRVTVLEAVLRCGCR